MPGIKTVKVKSDAHPSGFIIVNEDDQRAKVKKSEEPKQPEDKPKRRGRPRKSND